MPSCLGGVSFGLFVVLLWSLGRDSAVVLQSEINQSVRGKTVWLCCNVFTFNCTKLIGILISVLALYRAFIRPE